MLYITLRSINVNFCSIFTILILATGKEEVWCDKFACNIVSLPYSFNLPFHLFFKHFKLFYLSLLLLLIPFIYITLSIVLFIPTATSVHQHSWGTIFLQIYSVKRIEKSISTYTYLSFFRLDISNKFRLLDFDVGQVGLHKLYSVNMGVVWLRISKMLFLRCL